MGILLGGSVKKDTIKYFIAQITVTFHSITSEIFLKVLITVINLVSWGQNKKRAEPKLKKNL